MEEAPTLTVSQKRWLNSDYRAYMIKHRREKVRANPEFRDRMNKLKRESRLRVKARKLQEAKKAGEQSTSAP